MRAIHKVTMRAKLDTYKFTIDRIEVINGNTIVCAIYEDCLTFDESY